MNLHYQEYGNGQPLVILHGLLGSLDNWHSLSKTFASSFRVLAVDQRNHGRSPHSDVFTFAAMADDVIELLDQLKIRSAHILGHSMGGKTAMQCALSYPHRVDGLIVVDIAPREYPRLHDEILDALESVELSASTSRQQVDNNLSKKIPDPAVRQFLMKNLTHNFAGAFSWKPNLQVIRDSYKEIAREIKAHEPFPGPTLVVKGTRGNYVLESDTPTIKKLFPNSRIVGLDAGHWIHAEISKVFADIVMNFLGEKDG